MSAVNLLDEPEQLDLFDQLDVNDDRCRINFSISKEQYQLARTFITEHICEVDSPNVVYTFSPIGFGDVVEVHCLTCEQSVNITDISKW